MKYATLLYIESTRLTKLSAVNLRLFIRVFGADERVKVEMRMDGIVIKMLLK